MTYILWGYANSWIVHLIREDGRIGWCSHWMTTKAEAQRLHAKLIGAERRAA